ncbi:hypothetical protein GPA10_11585 [Streptomyces sp. p1417]|uniref:WD40-like Beta Propeller Repeat n=1 Tax=Streptomyces typhae TaxID=2681492 RepID=A0A6L6WX10_9ACTN|nr:PD40 domain-containing protein [Streptomyces typhae]MVO85376.1 hypothetical protein [Streptomyces typhae]
MARSGRKKRRGGASRSAGVGALALLLSAAALPAAVATPAEAPASAYGNAHAEHRPPGTGTTRLISVAADGGPADGASGNPVVSADGRVVAFTSQATNLVPGDTNGRADVFVRNLRTGKVQRVEDPLGPISSPALSAGGRYLAYTAQDGDTTAVVVRDLDTGGTERADADLPIGYENGGSPAISADGRTVAFLVEDTDPDTVGAQAVFLRDLRAKYPEQVSFPVSPDDDHRGFRAPSLSADGRKVAYQQVRGTPPRGDWSDVYVHDRATGGETQADTPHDGSPADGPATHPLLSFDGSTLAFDSAASNLVPGRDPNSSYNPFVRDLRTGKVRRIDAVLPGPEGVLSVDGVSADGSKLLLDTWPVHTTEDAEYLRDLRTGADILVSPDKDGRPANAVDARMDARARTVVFGGHDDAGFVTDDTNGVEDVFVRTVR